MAFLPSRGLCRLLPWVAVASVVLPWGIGEVIKTFHQPGLSDDPLRTTQFIDILVIAVIVFALTMVATAAVGCWMMRVMQTPARQGDAADRDAGGHD